MSCRAGRTPNADTSVGSPAPARRLVVRTPSGDRSAFDPLVGRYAQWLRGLVHAQPGETLRAKISALEIARP